MTANEVITKINEHASHLASLLGQLSAALRDQAEQAKAYPDLTKKIAEAEAKLGKVTSDLDTAEASLAKASASKAKLLKDLGAA